MPAVYSDMQVTEYIERFLVRFTKIEDQLALLSEKLGVPYDRPSTGAPADVVALVRAGDRMGAVRRYRELTGASGSEAAAFVANL
jgi:hypothetical protein